MKLKNKMHSKDLAQREKLLAREQAIKDMIVRHDDDRLAVIARRMVFNHILDRVSKAHVETYKRVQEKEEKVAQIAEECEDEKKKLVKRKTMVNAAKIEKFKWLARHEEEQKRKLDMINFRRGELKKLKTQSKKLGLVTDSQINVTNLMGLISTVQGAAQDGDADTADSSVVDKTTSTMMQLHKLYKVTDTADAEGVIATWRRSVEGLEALKNDRDKVSSRSSLPTCRATCLCFLSSPKRICYHRLQSSDC